jgi:hypothetical protein
LVPKHQSKTIASFPTLHASIEHNSARLWNLHPASAAFLVEIPEKNHAGYCKREIAEHSQENRFTEGPD